MRVALADHIKIVGGGTPSKSKPEYWDGDIPWVSVKDLKSELILQTQDHISESGVENSATRVLPKNTLIVATRMAVGKTAILGQASAINQDIKGIIPEATLDNSYLKYALDASRGELERLSTGATVKGIKIEHLMQLQIPLPSLPEQRRIAARLDAADRLRQLDRALVEKYDELKRSLFLEMFGDPVVNEMGWEVRKIEDLFSNRDSKRVPVKKSDREKMDDLYDYYGATGVIDKADSFTHEGSFLLVAEDGKALESRNKPIAFQAKGKIWVNNHAHVLEENGECTLAYGEWVFRFLDIRKYVTGIDQYKLNRTALNRIEFPVPPIGNQQRFVDRLTSLNRQQSLARRALGCSEEIFQGVLGEVFG